jgi:murein hydrolase activator
MSVNKGFGLILFVFALTCNVSVAQKSKSELQKEKQDNLEKITEAEKILSETTGKKQNTLGQLNALNQRIKTQEDLIGSIRSEMYLLSDEIDENNAIIESLSTDLKNLKSEYAAMVYAAYKASKGHDKLTFIFSAKSFNQFLMRLKYMEQYGEARKKQAGQIEKVQAVLSDQVTVIKSKVSEKNILLVENVQENKSLAELKKSQSSLVSNLQKQENTLKRDLEDHKNAVAKLDKLINDIILAEIEKARSAEKSTIAAGTKLASQFADNKSKLPWPVSGFVSQKFGKQNHPVLKGIIMNNTGVNIQTKQNEKVKTIFGGSVSVVAFIPLVGNTVLVSHGDYFTVYAGLKDVFVKTGQSITIGQELGSILTNKDGVSELKFEVRKSAAPLDPQLWLIKN